MHFYNPTDISRKFVTGQYYDRNVDWQDHTKADDVADNIIL